ncbi:MAG TPA: hypothetical protein VKX31_08635 [Brumimicrobium sp.]|nr:hypothetical protein [Brumimicrobium sp.]
MKKVLCFHCSKWSVQPEICEHCDQIISRRLEKEIQQKEIDRLTPPKPPSRIKKAMEYLKNSKNPLLKAIYYILVSISLLYIGIMMLIMYIISMATG